MTLRPPPATAQCGARSPHGRLCRRLAGHRGDHADSGQHWPAGVCLDLAPSGLLCQLREGHAGRHGADGRVWP